MNDNIYRVLKAPTKPVLDFASLQWGVHKYYYASDKEDGIRCIIHPILGPVSQWLKPIPNHWVRMLLNVHCPKYLDGELVAIDCKGNDADFNDTQSAIMTQDGQPRFEFRVFDWFYNQYASYERRLAQAKRIIRSATDPCIKLLEQIQCHDEKAIEKAEQTALLKGKEGLMLRQPGGWYKEGRSTHREAYLLKVKRFEDDEAKVIDVREEMENCNLATRGPDGLQKRSKHQAGMRGKGCVGKLICNWRGHKMAIGSGLTDAQKAHWWFHPEYIIGKTITFKFQRHGMKVLPRAPIFKGIRYDA